MFQSFHSLDLERREVTGDILCEIQVLIPVEKKSKSVLDKIL